MDKPVQRPDGQLHVLETHFFLLRHKYTAARRMFETIRELVQLAYVPEVSERQQYIHPASQSLRFWARFEPEAPRCLAGAPAAQHVLHC